MVFIKKPVVPLLQFFQGILLAKILQLLCIKISVSHLDSNTRTILHLSVNSCITFCLRQMDRHRLFYIFQVCENSLDLVNKVFSLFHKNAVCPSFYKNDNVFIFTFPFQRNLRPVCGVLPSLYFSVKAASFLHGFFVCCAPAAVNISLPQNKLYEISYRNANCWLFHDLSPDSSYIQPITYLIFRRFNDD